MEEVRLGTVGSGDIVRSILQGVSETEGITLLGVYSRSLEKGTALGKSFGCKKVYTEYAAMLQDQQVNTVYIASPNSLHYLHAKTALLAGKHVICEKPLCPEVWQADELFSIAEKAGKMLVEAVPTTFLPNFPLLQDAVSKIGRLRLVCGNYTQYSSRYDKLRQGEITNVFDPAFAGGCLMDLNFYNVYLTLALFGRPAKAVYAPNLYGGVDTSGVAVLNYPDFQVSLTGSKDSRGISTYDIQGEDGFLRVEGGSNGLKSIHLHSQDKEILLNQQENVDRWRWEIRSLVPVLLSENQERLNTLQRLSLLTCETLENMRKSCGIRFSADRNPL